MKIERTQNAKRNIIFGAIFKMYQLLAPFLMRTAMIYFMGVEYLGLSSLFASILQVLNLAELGVGSAMVYSMYKPIAEDDSLTLCALLRLYRRYYNTIGLVIGVIGLILTPFVPKLINGSVPENINIYVLYLMNLAATVLSYWLFSYKNSLLYAHQRNDISSKILLITSTLQYVVQFFILWIFKNYYLYVSATLITQSFTNVLTAVITTKLFPEYKAKGELDKEVVGDINQRIRDLFTSKMGTVIISSVDTIVISTFLGLKMLAVYQNYFFILTAIIGVIEIFFSACTAGIGNSLIVETTEKNFSDFKILSFLITWISGLCVCCLLNLYQPFMEIWTGKELMLDYGAVICLCIYFYVNEVNRVLTTYKDAGGIWHADRFRPLITGIVNLGINLITVQFWGIYGVILSTVFSVIFIGNPWLIYNLFTQIFNKKHFIEYIKSLLLYMCVTIVICILCCKICVFICVNSYLTIVIRGIVCVIIANGGFFIAYYGREELNQSFQLIDLMTNGKLKLKRLVKKSKKEGNV